MNLRAIVCAIFGHPIPSLDFRIYGGHFDTVCRRCRQPTHWFDGRWR